MAQALAQAQEAVTESLQELVIFLKTSGIEEHSVDYLNEFLEKHQTFELLSLAESFGKCNAFIDQDTLIEMIYKSWKLMYEGLNLERKQIMKRLKIYKEDKKTDPELIAKAENLLNEIENKRSRTMVDLARTKVMCTIPISEFKANPELDYLKRYKDIEEHKEQLLAEGRTATSAGGKR